MTEQLGGSARGFSWTAEAREGILIVSVKGELDLAVTTEEGAQLGQLAKRDERLVVIDLRHVTFLDSSGLRSLVAIRNGLKERGGRLLLGDLSDPVRRVIDVSGLRDWFEYVDRAAF